MPGSGEAPGAGGENGQSLNPNEKKAFVLIQDSDGNPVPRRVVLGLSDMMNYEVVSGLKEGEKIVLGAAGQVFINLFKNSQKASASNISARVFPESGKVIVDITDNGTGISPDDQPFVFERFYRGVAGMSSKHGLGLGLTISRLLARAHGGDLMLLNSGQGGTTFRLNLPYIQKNKTGKAE